MRQWCRKTAEEPEHDRIPDSQSDVAVFLEQARWLHEQHRMRSEAFERKAVALLGFSGVILVLITRTLDPVQDLTGHLHTVAVVLGCLTVVLLLSSATGAVGVLRARRGPSTSIPDTRALWLDRRQGQMSSEADIAFTEWLLDADALAAHRAAIASGDMKRAPVTSPVVAMSNEAESRGRWFTFSTVTLGAALLSLSILTCILIIAR